MPGFSVVKTFAEALEQYRAHSPAHILEEYKTFKEQPLEQQLELLYHVTSHTTQGLVALTDAFNELVLHLELNDEDNTYGPDSVN